MTTSKPLIQSSNWKIMRALMAKDWRLYNVPTLALLVLCIACYAIAGVSLLAVHDSYARPLDFTVLSALDGASGAAVLVVTLLSSAYGGVAIAGERSERTADFLALLPVTRTQIIMSKWIVSGVILGGFAMVNAAIAVLCSLPGIIAFYHNSQVFLNIFLLDAGLCLCVGTSLYGVAWMMSTFTRSGPISACASIAVSAISTVLIALYTEGHNIGTRPLAPFITALFCLLIGLSGLIGGMIYYRKRIAP